MTIKVTYLSPMLIGCNKINLSPSNCIRLFRRWCRYPIVTEAMTLSGIAFLLDTFNDDRILRVSSSSWYAAFQLNSVDGALLVRQHLALCEELSSATTCSSYILPKRDSDDAMQLTNSSRRLAGRRASRRWSRHG